MSHIYDKDDRAVVVRAEFTPGVKGGRDEFGRAMEPDDPDDIEILSLTLDESGKEIGGDPDERYLFELAEEQVREDIADYF